MSAQANQFSAPGESVGDVDAASAAALITAAADIALIVDDAGMICDVAFSNAELAEEFGGQPWIGSRWVDTVTRDSVDKIPALLAEAAGAARRRHVNQIGSGGVSIPILYSLVRIGSSGRMVAFGRDLRPLSSLQQRLVEAQQSMERDYGRLRQAETRYRLLFQSLAEPVIVLDAGSQKVVEANPPALLLLGEGSRRGAARSFLELFTPASRHAVEQLLTGIRISARPDEVRASLSEGEREVSVSAVLFRQDQTALLLIRLSEPAGQAQPPGPANLQTRMLKLLERAPDGFVVTDADGRILSANSAFRDLAQLASEEQAKGESLGRWIGQPGVEFDVLMANLRQYGTVRLFAATLRGEFSAGTKVEISAVSAMNADTPCYGFAIRDVGARIVARIAEGRERPRSVEQLTELIGRVPLKDLVREATDAIERMCIEAALELTKDNRASAAEMLGLSRQSLYVKLRRYGLGDLGGDGAEGGDPA